MEFTTAILFGSFLNGLSGSFHCLGMCGPLAGSLNFTGEKQNPVLTQTLYNLGRLFSYTTIGLAFGFLGKMTNMSLASLLPAQEFAAWFGASFIFLFGLSLLFGKDRIQNRLFSKFFGKIGSKLLKQNQTQSPKIKLLISFLFGALTGFLPCGILYPAFIMAFATGSPLFGAVSMFFFFLGTFPLLFGFGLGFRMIVSKFGKNQMRLVGCLIILVSISLLLFRMNHTHNHSEMKEMDHSHHQHH
ncbi:sulfite exporter TauE/SafE family protein [Leptospira sarikeiensis]|uniref:Sulfite exporter TauE/SafE family protein n=1 Tax=Leptospira sarikeiensis TaxID=2484943 RepID=A0A4R9JYR5_9LEPT|nr:sulfite exporter TauE/SafE family protein [Leptospira sarikeiensis]TGL58391.1 sulfite exporter TauE/SafE family protein [Leptospira sarikeiensis]